MPHWGDDDDFEDDSLASLKLQPFLQRRLEEVRLSLTFAERRLLTGCPRRRRRPQRVASWPTQGTTRRPS